MNVVFSMNLPGLSAGTGPAAAILIGGVLAFNGHALGIPILLGGFGLSAFWALKFK